MEPDNCSPVHDPFKIRLWAALGVPKSGKTSTIGALMSQTKQGPGGGRDILLRGGGWLYIHCYRQSVQEANKSPQQSIAETVAAARKMNQSRPIAYYNVLFALRSDVCNNHPKADIYLGRYIRAGWELQSLILLDLDKEYDHYVRFGAPTALIENSSRLLTTEKERNWVFGQARNHFGWA